MRCCPLYAIVLCLFCYGCDAPDVISAARVAASTERPTISVAAWNIRYFSDGSRDDEELMYIASVLFRYDFIAITEIRDERVLIRTEAMLQRMGRDYDSLISAQVGNVQKERYAFLYDRSLVNAVADGVIFPDPDDVFIREPYYATFRADQFDFTAIVTHVIYGDSAAVRRAEVQALAPVFRSVQDADASEQDVILLGDFNRQPSDDAAFAPLLAIPFMQHLFDVPFQSNISNSNPKLYDNILFQSNYLTEYTGGKGSYAFDEIQFDNDDKAASLAVSDHRPVWATFFTDVDDD